MTRVFRRIAITLWWFVAISIISAALLLGLARLILPSVGNYRSAVEDWLSEYLQQRVSVESLDLRWRGLGPQLTLTGLRIADPAADATLLGVRQAYVDTDLWNLLLGREGVVRDIDLAGLAFRSEIREDGSITVQGVELWNPRGSGSQQQPREVLAVLAAPRRITLSDVSLRVHDRRRNVAHQLRGISVHLRHIDAHHLLHVELPLPSALGEHISINLDFVGDPAFPQTWVGTAYAALDGVQLHNWTAFVPDVPLQLTSGTLDGEVWADWEEMSLGNTHARLSLRNLTVIAQQPQGGVTRWRAIEFGGDWRWQRTADGWLAQVDRFRLREESGGERARTSGRFEYRAGEQGHDLRGRWGYVNLADIAGWLPLAQTLGLDAELTRQLQALQPRGEIHDVEFHYPLRDDGAPALRMRFDRLSARAVGEFPGFTGLSGALDLRATAGRVRVRSESFTLDYPQMFRDPLRAQRLVGDFGFDLADGIRLWTPHLELFNEHAESVGRLQVHWQAEQPLWLDLQADFRNADGRATSRYLPVGIMPQPLTDWLDTSIVEGRVPRGSMLLYGPVQKFPFRGGEGVFQVNFGVRDAVLQFQPDWPRVEQAAARVRFAQAGLTIDADKGRIHGMQVQESRVEFVDLRAGEMRVRGIVAGDVAQNLSFLRASPLRKPLGAFLDRASGAGASVTAVDLSLPIREPQAFDVSGIVTLQDASLVADAWQLDLDRLQGELRFTKTGFAFDRMQGRLYKRPVELRAERVGERTRVFADGAFPAGALLGPQLPALKARLDGSTQWQLQVDLPETVDGDVILRARSTLYGIGVELPAPLRKPPAQEEDFDLRLVIQRGGDRVRTTFRYGQLLSADLMLTRNARGALNLTRGVVRSGDTPARLHREQGLHVTVDADRLDLDGWWMFTQGLSGAGPAPGPLERVNLRAAEATYNGRSIGPLSATVYRTPVSWVGGIENPLLSGSIDWPLDIASGRRLLVDLQKLDLALFEKPAQEPDEPEPATVRPQELPPLRIAIASLQRQDVKLDKVLLIATPHDRNLALDEMSFDNGALRLVGTGDWREGDDGVQRSRVEFRVESDDWGDGLARAGYPKTMRDGDGHIAVDVSWRGALYQPAVASLQGSVRASIDRGSLIGADPGLGRFVGLFSLQALPRRLALDFKDFLAEGFDFDRIRGSLELANGKANIREMRMDGTVGRIDITGRSDLVAQTYQQRVVVTPNLSASLPLAGELVVPGSGITVLLLGALLKSVGADLGKLGEMQYTLTGPWDNPEFEKVSAPKPKSRGSARVSDR